MSLPVYIVLDTATPALVELAHNIAPSRLQARIGPACADLMRRHYLTLPRNKMGGESTNFWQQASDAVRWEREGTGVVIITDKIGVRQRLLGGVIRPVEKKNLAIPANPLAYGKLPSEFSNLKFVQFGRGQGAPKALMMIGEVSHQITHKRGKNSGFKASAANLGNIVMFWLKDSVNQEANPNVIPSEEQFMDRIESALEPLTNN